ncbi:MAG: MMPL family transporter [Methylococcales bacterium]|nr:MMPL family transporter [Methylococcales bacterium]
MPKQSYSFSNALLWCEHQVLRFPWTLLLLVLLLCGISLDYTIKHLGMNTNTSDMLSVDLPFQQNRIRIDKAFPQDAGTIILVVDAETPEETSQAANKLADLLSKEKQHFDSVYIPTENDFFRQQALLYLDENDLNELAKKLTDAQPFIGHLAQNYHLDGLFSIVSQALNTRDQTLPMDLNPLLVAISDSLQHELDGQAHYLSWQNLLAANKLNTETNRSLVIAKPKMHFDELLPADVAQTAARAAAKTIMSGNKSVRVRITGETALEHEELESVSKGAAWSGLASLILVCLALWTGLRSVKLMLATLLVLIMGLILTAGFAALVVGHLNIISIAFASLYIGLGVDYAIHVCLHYRENKSNGLNNISAIRLCLKEVSLSLLLCTLTTAIGFLAFIPTDYAGVSELGIISGAGMFIGLLVSLTILPAIFCIFPVHNPKPIKSALTPPFIVSFPFRFATPIKIISIVLGLVSCLVLTELTFDSNPINLRDPNSESVSTIKELLKSKTESPFALTVLTDNLDDANKLAANMQQLSSVHEAITLSSFVAENQEEKLIILDDLNLVLGNQLKHFGDTLGTTDVKAALVKFNNELNKAIAEKSPNASPAVLQQLQQHVAAFIVYADKSANPLGSYQELEEHILGLLPFTMERLRTSLTATEFTINDIPSYIRSQWVSNDGLYRVVITPEKDQNKQENLKEFVAQTQSVDNTVSGLPVADQAGGTAVVNAFIEAFGGAFIVIVLLLLVIFRNIKKTLLVIFPLLLAAVLTGAANVLLNNPFNFANIIALPLLLGMGVDSGIHIMQRHHSALCENDNLLETSTARGVVFCSITTLCSFSSLAFTTHQGTSSMGVLLAIGISFTLICSLIVLPAFSGDKRV